MHTEQTNSISTAKTIQIAYWVDGYWIRDLQEAATLDQFEAFGNIPHRVTEVDANADTDTIADHIQTLCAGWWQTTVQPCAQGESSLTD